MLGKGLESLIPQKPQHPSDATNQNLGQVQNEARSQNQNIAPVSLPTTLSINNDLTSTASTAPFTPFTPHIMSAPAIIHEQEVEPLVIQPQPKPMVERPTTHQPSTLAQPMAPKVFEVKPASSKDDPQQPTSIFHIELDKITPNPDQPRRNFDQDALNELANSIREFGFLQPLVVSQVKKETNNGIEVEYQIIAGERRFHAAKILGLARVPAIVRNVSLEREKLELGVIENIQRENLNPIETARAFQRLQEEFRMTQREIAAKLGKSREVVANAVRLLDLPEYVQKALEQGEISESNARLLLNVEDPGRQQQLLREIIDNKLTTRDVKERVNHTLTTASVGMSNGAVRRGRPPMQEVHLAPEVRAMQDELSTTLGAPVEISKTAHNGKISITFFSEEELENILRRLGNEHGRL